jgi:hypothetical protein
VVAGDKIFLKETLSYQDWRANRVGPSVPQHARAAQRAMAAASTAKTWQSRKQRMKGMSVCHSCHLSLVGGGI